MRLPSALCALLLTVGCNDFACGVIGDPPFDEPPLCPVLDGPVCESDRDCAGGFCDRGLDDGFCGTCVALVCIATADCNDGETCDVVRGRCEATNACEVLAPERGCDEGVICAPIDARAQCTVPVVASCELVPATLLVTDGRAALIEVLALDDAGRPLPVAGEVTLPASAAGVARCAGPAPCRDVVTATAGGASCTAPSIVLPDVTPGTVRVVVRDVDTGALLANASVRVDNGAETLEALTDADGTVEIAGPSIASVRVDAEGYESVVVLGAGDDVEVPMPRRAAPGTRAGVLYVPDYAGMPAAGDVAIGIGSLSTPDLVDALDADTLAGPLVEATFEIEGVTDPGGDVTTQPSATTMTLGNSDFLGTGVALGRPGARLLSLIGTRLRLADLGGPIGATSEPGARVYDLMLGLWDQGVQETSFDLVGTVPLVEGPVPATTDDFAAFAGEAGTAEPHPVLDASDELDVVVPQLLAGDDGAFVALYARVPGRGFVLLALRFVGDDDGDGFVDDPLSADSLATVRLFVAPSLWTAGRELIAVAGSQRREDQRDGTLATDRVSARVTGPSTQLPPFRADDGALVEGLNVTLVPSADAVHVIHGDGFRVYVAGDALAIDVAALGFTGDIERVWALEGAPSFAPGTLDVARALATPRSARAVFVRP